MEFDLDTLDPFYQPLLTMIESGISGSICWIFGLDLHRLIENSGVLGEAVDSVLDLVESIFGLPVILRVSNYVKERVFLQQRWKILDSVSRNRARI